MASTYDVTASVSAPPVESSFHRVEFKFLGTDVATAGLAQNETVSLYQFPAGAIILGAQMKVLTAQSDVTDVDLGVHTSGSTDASLLDGVSLASAAFVGVTIAAPVYCNAATYLVLTNKDAQAWTTGKVKIMVSYIDNAPLLAV